MISNEFSSDTIIVFDEAHNIDNVCIEALSVTLDKRHLDASSRNIMQLQQRVLQMKISDQQRLQEEYKSLVSGLISQGLLSNTNTNTNTNAITAPVDSMEDGMMMQGPPILPRDILEEAVPGNIRKAEHFLLFLKKIVEFLKCKMKNTSVTKETPLAFLQQFIEQTAMDKKPLQFTYSRLNSLLRTLKITAIEEYMPIQDVCNFATLISTYLEGVVIIMEPEVSNRG